MKVNYDILGTVTDNHEEAALLLLDAIANESGNSLISVVMGEQFDRRSVWSFTTYTALRVDILRSLQTA